MWEERTKLKKKSASYLHYLLFILYCFKNNISLSVRNHDNLNKNLKTTRVVESFVCHQLILSTAPQPLYNSINEPVHEIMVLISYAKSEGLGATAHPRSYARVFAIRTLVERIRQRLKQCISPTKWLGMHIWRKTSQRSKSTMVMCHGSNGVS